MVMNKRDAVTSRERGLKVIYVIGSSMISERRVHLNLQIVLYKLNSYTMNRIGERLPSSLTENIPTDKTSHVRFKVNLMFITIDCYLWLRVH